MSSESTQIADDLRSVADRIADQALATLRKAIGADSEEKQAELRKVEKRLTRARRSVEKAISLLDDVDSGEDDS